MSVLLQDILSIMEELAPRQLAESWDNPGLLVGNPNQPVESILFALDVTEENVEYAVQHGIHVIISHHPFIFKKLSAVRTDTWQGRVLEKLIKHDIAVFAAHTNWDIAGGGVNDILAEAIGLQDIRGLYKTGKEPLCKLVVYVPESHARIVRHVLGEAGAGHIGNYSHCLFSAKGIGQFKPLEGTRPFIGKIGKIEEVEEVRIETVVPKSEVNKVLERVREVHPYEEIAYDIYELSQEYRSYALGRIGRLKQAMTAKELSMEIKKALGLSHIAVAGEENTRVYTVAVCGGAGAEFAGAAKQAGAQYYLTGDVKYHEAQAAVWQGLGIADGGHFGTEFLAVQALKRAVEEKIKERGWEVQTAADETAADIWQHW